MIGQPLIKQCFAPNKDVKKPMFALCKDVKPTHSSMGINSTNSKMIKCKPCDTRFDSN